MSSKNTIEIDLEIWQKNHQILVAARANAVELLEEHEKKPLTMSEKKHHAIGAMYENEIRILDALLEYSGSHKGMPF